MIAAPHTFRRSYVYVPLATLAVVVVADFLLYGHVLGWTAAAIAALLVAVIALRDTRFLATFGGRVIWLATLGLFVALVEQPTKLNLLYVFLCISALALTNSHGWESDFWRWTKRWTHWLFTSWTHLFSDNSIAMRFLMRRGLSPAIARVILGWALPLLLSAVFIALFAWANPIISRWLGRFGEWLGQVLNYLPELLNFSRIVFWLGFAIAAWALLRSRIYRAPMRLAPERDERPPKFVSEPANITPLVVRCLILFNLIFLVENVLDSYYLWAHQGMDATEFKQYVRRGAYPLVAAALLAGAFVLITFRPGSDTEKSPAARKLVYIWIGQTILLTISAAWRLARYVEMTELTRLRVASTIWFTIVGLGLIYIVWRIIGRRSNGWLINANALTALIILYPCCFINFDGLIANFNARHCEEVGGGGSPLDIEYYRTLGPTSVAALDSVMDRIPYEARRDWAQKVSTELHAELDVELKDWRSWTWRRHRAAQAAEDVRVAKARASVTVYLRVPCRVCTCTLPPSRISSIVRLPSQLLEYHRSLPFHTVKPIESGLMAPPLPGSPASVSVISSSRAPATEITFFGFVMSCTLHFALNAA